MLISYKIQTLDFTNDVLDLLCQIDARIAKLSKNKLNSIRYGSSIKDSSKEYFILTKYKQILQSKAINDICLKNYLLDDVMSNIKQYLTVGKIQKFKQTSFIEDLSYSPNTKELNTSVSYKDYGNNVTNNSITNKYVTEVIKEENWDQIDW